MARILLLLENKQNRALLASWLSQHYRILQEDEAKTASIQLFDLCLIDGPTLDRRSVELQAWKADQAPLFLPVILLTSYREVELITRHLWKSIDELVRLPVEKTELQARVEMLLRTREQSLALTLRNDDLESFFHAMTHDLRAPLRAIKGFTALLTEEQDRLSEEGRRYLQFARNAADQMDEIIHALVDFARVSSAHLTLQAVDVEKVLIGCIEQQRCEIEGQGARVKMIPPFPTIEGHPFLLKIAVTNLLSNALKFVEPGGPANITLRSYESRNLCRLEIKDAGIGIPLEDQKRLFRPFVQLHGIEEYGGIGLGLATVRKAVELMGGRVGVASMPGQGSLFWIELRKMTKGKL